MREQKQSSWQGGTFQARMQRVYQALVAGKIKIGNKAHQLRMRPQKFLEKHGRYIAASGFLKHPNTSLLYPIYQICKLFCTKEVSQGVELQNAENRHINVCWKGLPEKLGPLEENVTDVERVEYPCPIRVAQLQICLSSCCLCVSNVSSVEI